MDKLMMLLGYVTLISFVAYAIAVAIEFMAKLHKNLYVVRLNKLSEDQLRHLISSASALLEQKRRK